MTDIATAADMMTGIVMDTIEILESLEDLKMIAEETSGLIIEATAMMDVLMAQETRGMATADAIDDLLTERRHRQAEETEKRLPSNRNLQWLSRRTRSMITKLLWQP